MSVQRLNSVVRHSQQASRVNAAIEGPRRKLEGKKEDRIAEEESNRGCPAQASKACAGQLLVDCQLVQHQLLHAQIADLAHVERIFIAAVDGDRLFRTPLAICRPCRTCRPSVPSRRIL